MTKLRTFRTSLLALTTLTLVACDDAPVNSTESSSSPGASQSQITNNSPVDPTNSAGKQSAVPFDLETSFPMPLPPEQSATLHPKKRNNNPPIEKLPKSEFRSVEWTDLLPQDDLDALMNPPSYITEIAEGSTEDSLEDVMRNNPDIPADDPYQLALKSSKVIPTLSGQAIRIPGFVVPLEFDDEQMITQFFLVPFFGACIHVPPPPPNQIIFVDFPEGFRPRALFDPFWISGILKTDIIQNELATAAYTMQMHHLEPYTEEE